MMWPFTRSTQPILSRDSVWPPPEHEERLARYERHRRIYLGKHFEAFRDPMRGADHDLFPQYYIAANLAAQVSHTASDLLFGEPPRFIADQPELQPIIDEIEEDNDLITKLQRAARGQSYRGDAVFKVRWDAGRAVIESVPPETFFPVYDPTEPGQLLSVVLAWLVDLPDGGPEGPGGLKTSRRSAQRQALRMEIHTPGRIQNLAFPFKEGRLGQPMDLAGLAPDLAGEVDTGLGEIPVVHIPNLQTDDSGPFGLSDYTFFESIQAEINNRLSQISTVLDKHADPNMVVPLQALDTDGAFRAVSQKAWPIDAGDIRPEYVTWDGKLDAAFRELEVLRDLFFMVSGVSPSTLGVEDGTGQESGRAIRLRQLRTLKWIENKRSAWTRGLGRMFDLAQQMQSLYGPSSGRVALSEPIGVQVLWRDGLPTDRTSDIDDAVSAVAGRVMSIESGIRLAQGLEGEQLAAEAARVRGEAL